MGLLNDAASDIGKAATGIGNALSGQNYTAQDFQQNGFVVPPIPNATGNGLPSSQIPSQRFATATRNTAHWFVPEIGVINMYINPQSINYNNSKLINNTRTKGGFLVQYWGEALSILRINGHTGSSGVEGLNVLYEIYRSEQLMFDSTALVMAASNSVSGVNSLVDSALGNLGGAAGGILTAASGLVGLDPASQNILPQNPPSLASMALGIELYYTGWVFRGYFNNFNFTESVSEIGLFTYDIEFVVTQRRGYRVNSMPWQRSAIDGPSNAQVIPLSFEGLQTAQNTGNLSNNFLNSLNPNNQSPFGK
jgi:hypothetical protein